MQDDTNLYDILGVTKEASHADIKKAYRNLSKENHSDTSEGELDPVKEARQRDLNKAWEVLGDTDARQFYDSTGIVDRQSMEEQARQTIADVFVGCVLQGIANPKDATLKYFDAQVIEHTAAMRKGRDLVNALDIAIKRLKYKGKDNDFLTPQLNAKKESIKNEIVSHERAEKMMTRCRAMVQDGFDYDAPKPGMFGAGWPDSTSRQRLYINYDVGGGASSVTHDFPSGSSGL